MPKKHKLGFGSGSIIEYEDGTAAYVAPASFSQTFRVRIADVTGFSVTKGNKAMERTLNVLGNGTLLGSASVNHGVAEKVEAWFRAHPHFGAGAHPASASEAAGSSSVADELRKPAQLHQEDILTDAEFAVQKAHLLVRLTRQGW